MLSCPGSNKQVTAASSISWPMRRRLPFRPNPALSRFASTDTKTTPIAEISSTYASATPQPEPDASNLVETPGPFDQLLEPPIHEYIGYMKDMGLDYGWGPTAFIQTVLEYVHIYTGAPWWATIALTVLGIRATIFKFYINAQDSSARQTAIKPLLQPLEARQRAAMAASDQRELQAITRERQVLLKNHGVKLTAIFMPLVFQLPLGFGTFRCMRGMSYLPVPGFDEGGFLWLYDLTTPDPFLILPVATAGMYYLVFKSGAETGGARSMSPNAYKFFGYVVPLVTGCLATFWPVALQIPILINGILAFSQNFLFRQLWFRRLCGIQPLGVIRTEGRTSVNRGPKPTKPGPKDFRGSMKKVYTDAIEQGKKVTGGDANAQAARRQEAEFKKAKAYEEKIAREAAQRRFEAKQAKEMREEERRHRSTLE